MNYGVREFIVEFRKSLLYPAGLSEITQLSEFLALSKARGGIVYFFGNGASASIASTLAFKALAEQGVPSIPFSDHNMLLGMSRKKSFSEWMSACAEGFLKPQDSIVLISSSGESDNVINVAKLATSLKIPTFSLTGFDSENRLRSVTEKGLWIDSSNYNVVETAHLVFGLLALRFLGLDSDERLRDFAACIDEFQSLPDERVVLQLVTFSDRLSRFDFEKSRVVFIGDGSSSSIASHLATDFSKSGLTAQTINDHNFLSASQNDFGSEDWLSVGVQRSWRPDDILILVAHSTLFPAEIKAISQMGDRKAELYYHGTEELPRELVLSDSIIYKSAHPVTQLVAPSLGLLAIAEEHLSAI